MLNEKKKRLLIFFCSKEKKIKQPTNQPNKQTNKEKKSREVDMYTKFEILVFVHSLFFFVIELKTKKTKMIYIFFILLSSFINSSTCGERVGECTLSRSKQSINDNVISSLPYVISKTVYVANNVHIAVKKSVNGR